MMRPDSDRPIYRIYFEGAYNKTEHKYFQHYQRRYGPYILRFHLSAKTDLKGMADGVFDNLVNYVPERGDRLFLLADLDDAGKRKRIMQEAIWRGPEYQNIEFLLSNPSFEVFFLNHFGFSAAHFRNQDEAIRVLKKKLGNYEKNEDVFDKLGNVEEAIANSKMQHRYGDPYPDSAFSDAYVLVELLLGGG